MGNRLTNRQLGYAEYGQSESTRSQVYPGTPTLAVAPSRIDFNPSSSSGVNKGWVRERSVQLRYVGCFHFFLVDIICHCVKLSHIIGVLIFPSPPLSHPLRSVSSLITPDPRFTVTPLSSSNR